MSGHKSLPEGKAQKKPAQQKKECYTMISIGHKGLHIKWASLKIKFYHLVIMHCEYTEGCKGSKAIHTPDSLSIVNFFFDIRLS